MQIRLARHDDRDAIWHILRPTIRAGETYALPRDLGEADAIAYWMGPDRETFVAEEHGLILGTYFLRPNQLGGGAHVANCGYVTAPEALGRGVARRMCEHSPKTHRKSRCRKLWMATAKCCSARRLQPWCVSVYPIATGWQFIDNSDQVQRSDMVI